jgi:hypothetical protein
MQSVTNSVPNSNLWMIMMSEGIVANVEMKKQ